MLNINEFSCFYHHREFGNLMPFIKLNIKLKRSDDFYFDISLAAPDIATRIGIPNTIATKL